MCQCVIVLGYFLLPKGSSFVQVIAAQEFMEFILLLTIYLFLNLNFEFVSATQKRLRNVFYRICDFY